MCCIVYILFEYDSHNDKYDCHVLVWCCVVWCLWYCYIVVWLACMAYMCLCVDVVCFWIDICDMIWHYMHTIMCVECVKHMHEMIVVWFVCGYNNAYINTFQCYVMLWVMCVIYNVPVYVCWDCVCACQQYGCVWWAIVFD